MAVVNLTTVLNGEDKTTVEEIAKATSGDDTPIATNVANVASATIGVLRFTKSAITVACYASVSITPTAASTITKLRVSLPISSSFSSTAELIGVAWCVASSSNPALQIGARIYADTTNDEALIEFVSTATAAHICYVNFSYKIV